MSQNNGNSIVAILAGVALGATAGILFAPDKGSKTRGKIKDGIDDAKNKFQGRYADTKHDVEGSYDELLSNLSHKAEDAISFLEDKLAELRKQNAKFQK